MKRVLFFLFCGLFLMPLCRAQTHSGRVIYGVHADKAMMNQVLEKIHARPKLQGGLTKMFKHQIQTLPYLFYQLDFNKAESRFYRQESMANDNGLDLESSAKNVGVTGIYYTNLDTGNTLHQVRYIGTQFLTVHNAKAFDWTLTDEKKTIAGYTCYKATTHYKADVGGYGDNVIAWYAPDLPFQFGPMVYTGLPGMVLEVKQGYYILTAKKVSISKRNKKIQKPEEGRKMTVKEFHETKEKLKSRFRKGR